MYAAPPNERNKVSRDERLPQDNLKSNQIAGAVIKRQHGGKREGAGKPKGALSEATKQRKALEATLKQLAAEHTHDALNTLVTIMKDDANPPAARVSAATQVLDRGHGKPTQTIAGDPDNPIQTHSVIEYRVVRPTD